MRQNIFLFINNMKSKNNYLLGVCFIVIVSSVMHYLFSRFGFALSDDGFILGYSRRILDGQVPYRDFINIRTILSAYLHAPVVLLGGDYTFWLSRFIVWLQYAFIAWIWSNFIEYFFDLKIKVYNKIIYSFIAFIFTANISWLIVTQTVDVIFVFSLGIYLYIRNYKFLGYFLIGSVFLFRQSFVLIPFLSIILFSDYKKLRYWMAILLPSVLFFLFLFFNNALNEAFLILRGQEAILDQWKNNLFFKPGEFLLGVVLGFLTNLTIIYSKKIKYLNFLSIVLINSVIIFPGYKLLVGAFTYEAAYFIVGILVGSIVFYLLNDKLVKSKIIIITILVFFLIFSSTFGMCTRSPVYVSGIAVLLFFGFSEYFKKNNKMYIKIEIISIILSTLILLGCFVYARLTYVFNDWPAVKLKSNLNEVMKGAKLIKTNNYTYDLLKDLNVAIEKTNGYKYTILEWFCGWWVKSEQKNPISIDLAVNPELPNQVLTDKVCEELVEKRGELLVIVPKVGSIKSANGLCPMSDAPYPFGKLTSPSWYLYSDVTRYVMKNFNKVDETKYFLIYK